MRNLLKTSFLGLLLSSSSLAYADTRIGGVGDSCKQNCCNQPKFRCSNPCQPQPETKEFYKNFNKKFQNVQNKTVYVSNKHGKVEVKTGATNEVLVNVHITARCQNEQRANEIFSRIDIAFSEDGNQMKSETNINAAKGWGKENGDFSIDYEVIMPQKNSLTVVNSYGHTVIPILTGKVRIEQKYGDFWIADAPNIQLALAYGKGAIHTCGQLNGTVGYASLDVSVVNAANLKSKYSHLHFNKTGSFDLTTAYDDVKIVSVQNIKTDSRYSDFMMNSVGAVTLTGEYTDVKILKLDGNGTFSTNYGGVNISELGNNFGVLDVKGTYTDYQLHMAPNTSFQIDAQGHYADFSRPTALRTSVEKSKGSTQEFHGTVGNPNTKNIMRIRLTYGDLIIK
ncbi:MAG: hypothetical protein RL757_710 [Bacteroidota bacterium]|jgi:hypothetical protein